jgi:hypothetical protein
MLDWLFKRKKQVITPEFIESKHEQFIEKVNDSKVITSNAHEVNSTYAGYLGKDYNYNGRIPTSPRPEVPKSQTVTGRTSSKVTNESNKPKYYTKKIVDEDASDYMQTAIAVAAVESILGSNKSDDKWDSSPGDFSGGGSTSNDDSSSSDSSSDNS